jgi:hypothetical protein
LCVSSSMFILIASSQGNNRGYANMHHVCFKLV